MFSQNSSRTPDRCIYPPFPRSVWNHPNAPTDEYDLVCKCIWLVAKKTKDELDLWQRLNIKKVHVHSSDSPPTQRNKEEQGRSKSGFPGAEKQKSPQQRRTQELQKLKEQQEKLEQEPLSKESRLHLYRSNLRQAHNASPAPPPRPDTETRPKEQGAHKEERGNMVDLKQLSEPHKILMVGVEQNKTDKAETLPANSGSITESAGPHGPSQEDTSPAPLSVSTLGRRECESEDEPEARPGSRESGGSSDSDPLPSVRSAATDSSDDDSDIALPPLCSAENAKCAANTQSSQRIQFIDAKQNPEPDQPDVPSLQRLCSANAKGPYQNYREKKAGNKSFKGSSCSGEQQLQKKQDQQQRKETPEQEPLLKESRLLRFYRPDFRQPHTASPAPPLGPEKETEAQAKKREAHKDQGNMVDHKQLPKPQKTVAVDKHQNKTDKAEPLTAISDFASGSAAPHCSPALSKVPRLGSLKCDSEDEAVASAAVGKSSGSGDGESLLTIQCTASDSSDDVVLSDMEVDLPATTEKSPNKTVPVPWEVALLEWNLSQEFEADFPTSKRPGNFKVIANAGPYQENGAKRVMEGAPLPVDQSTVSESTQKVVLRDKEDTPAHKKRTSPARPSSPELPQLCNTMDVSPRAAMENVPKKKIQGQWGPTPLSALKQGQEFDLETDFPTLRRPCDGKGPLQEHRTKRADNNPSGVSSICAGNQKSVVDPQTCIQTISCEPRAANHQLAPGGADGVGVAARTWANTAKAGINQSAAALQEKVKLRATINRIWRFSTSKRGGLSQGNNPGLNPKKSGQQVQNQQVKPGQQCKVKGNPTRR